jgi:hypothetical protein
VASVGSLDTVVFKTSTASALKLIGGSCAFVAMGYYNVTQQPVGSLLHTISRLGIWFFALGIPVGLLQLLGFTMSVTLSRGGLIYRIFFLKRGPIPWCAIRSVTITPRGTSPSGKVRNLVLIDTAGLSRPIMLSPTNLGTTAEELADAIRRRIDTFAGKTVDTSTEEGTS